MPKSLRSRFDDVFPILIKSRNLFMCVIHSSIYFDMVQRRDDVTGGMTTFFSFSFDVEEEEEENCLIR